jgi:cyclin-dependent kinase 7
MRSNRKIAIKKIKLVNMEDGVNFTALREIKVLQELKHPNVIEVCVNIYKYDLN